MEQPCCNESSPTHDASGGCCAEAPKKSAVEFALYQPAFDIQPQGPVYSESDNLPPWIEGFIGTAIGKIPVAGTSLNFTDTLGSWKARWGINRMNYIVQPGLYGIGNPGASSVVFVSANYKMSFDRLRKELSGLDAWIMVIDTKGINVWCAAGKGTFGTEEIIRRIAAVQLSRVVSHRSIIVPQLGAPGVAAHEVQKKSGFKVIYGPVRASDIQEFLQAAMKATPEMRAVTFGFVDRLVLTPIEIVNIYKPVIGIAAALLVLHLTGLVKVSMWGIYPFIGAVIAGAVAGPVLLPWLPGRAFSVKGAVVGLLWTLLVLYVGNIARYGILNSLALFLILPAISAFLTLNFTGASTYTSLSGVRREMKFAIPVIISSTALGLGLWLAGRFA
ncbi:MAG: dehydrogenase/acetyl-CoA synthase gamma subunit (corrinoid Fe-S protein) [Deltaproteobacteria bacterium]|nr:dehydrogenase/acetyl-CoA synthase gamma subunit (corrinoid Fe-S protein) [Deltaproteobacteria bacterium]